MKVTASTRIAQVKPEEVQRFVDIALEDIVRVVNGGLGPDNFDGQVLTVTFSTANVSQAFPHTLGRAPSYYICLGSSAATSIYDGSSANTGSLIYLRATVATTARILIL